MSQPLDPFVSSFDQIDPDRGAYSRAAFDHTFEKAAQRAAVRKSEPGFYLIEDAQGRFTVDRHMGVISLANEALIDSEHNAVHAVRLHVVEQSGASYELEMKLRITGRIPSMVGAEDIDLFAGLPPPEGPPNLAREVAPAEPSIAPQIGWTSFSAARGEIGKAALRIDGAPFAAALEQMPAPDAPGPFRLHLFTPLPTVSELGATWSL